jgi:hypothetical protein
MQNRWVHIYTYIKTYISSIANFFFKDSRVCICLFFFFFLIKLNFGFTRTISHLASVVFLKRHKQKQTNKKKTKAKICMRTHLVELKKKKKPCFYIFFFPIFLFIILGIVVDMIWLHRPYFSFFFPYLSHRHRLIIGGLLRFFFFTIILPL